MLYKTSVEWRWEIGTSPQRKFLLNLGMKCWNFQHFMHKLWGNYNSCTCRSSENISSSSGDRRSGKRKEGVKKGWKLSLAQQKSCAFLSFTPLLKANVLVCKFFFWILSGFGSNSGFWCYVFLTLRKTLMNGHIFNGWLVVLVQNCSDVARK